MSWKHPRDIKCAQQSCIAVPEMDVNPWKTSICTNFGYTNARKKKQILQMELANVSYTTWHLWSPGNFQNRCQGGGSGGYEMGVRRGIWDSVQTLIHCTGETTMHKLRDMMDEKERSNHKAHYARQHIFMPDKKSFLGTIRNPELFHKDNHKLHLSSFI